MDELIFNFLNNVPTIILVGVIFGSLYILGEGADFLVDEAIILSNIWRIPKAIIGATVVSLGTTIPELTVSTFAAAKGSPDLALGNAIGSIITNTTLILGAAAFIGIVPVDKSMIKKQGGVLLFSVLLFSVLSLPIINGGNINRLMGILMLVALIIYIIMTIKGSKDDSEEIIEGSEKRSIFVQILRLMLGILIVIISSKILIPSVQITATRIGIPESIIAATLVAFGTSVPELMTSITAVKRGHGELAIGNVIGANILNILFVVGLSAVVSKDGLLVPALYFKLQIPTMIITTMTLFIIGLNEDGKLVRKHGILLLIMYIIYLLLNYIL